MIKKFEHLILFSLLFLQCFFNVFLVSAWTEEKTFFYPVTGEIIRSFNEDEHRGVDIQIDPGQEVIAAGQGRVAFRGYTPAGGDDSKVHNTISIVHPNALRTTYLGLSEIFVSPGQEIEKGQVIGRTSTFEYFNRNHLHFGIKIDKNQYLNPSDYAEFLKVDGAKVDENNNSSEVVLTQVTNKPQKIKRELEIDSGIISSNQLIVKEDQCLKNKVLLKIREEQEFLKFEGKFLPIETFVKTSPSNLSRVLNNQIKTHSPEEISWNQLNLVNQMEKLNSKIYWRDYLWATGIILLADFLRRKISVLKLAKTKTSYVLGYG